MNFLAPAAFGLAVLLPIIIAMYLLKLRRTEQVVSSVYLWQRMVRDVEANAPWQRLRRNLLLLLQLLFLGVLILVLAQPFIWSEGISGQSVIFIVDISASMASVDSLPNRLEAAKDQARQLVDSLPEDARVTVIAASTQAQVLVSSTQDRLQIYRVLDALQTDTGGSDLSSALGLASAIASRQPDTEIIILSDGRVNVPQRLGIKGRLRYFPIGTSGDNQAISLLNLETRGGGKQVSAFAQITNYAAEDAQRRLELYVDGILFNAFDLEIPAEGQRAVIAEDIPAGTKFVEAVLAGQDTLPLDNRAWVIAHQGEPVELTFVTEGNRFLETGLRLLPGISLTILSPDDYEAGPGRETFEPVPEKAIPGEELPRLTIFDAYLPISSGLPSGNLMFIAPPRSNDFFSVLGRIDGPGLSIASAGDPLVANLSVSQVNILDAVSITEPDWSHRVLEGNVDGNGYPLLIAGKTDDRRVAVLAFDIRRSDLPLQVAFPILLSNLVNWLSPGGYGELPSQVEPGTALTLLIPPEFSSATITRPDGNKTNLSISGGRGIFAGTTQLGIYQVNWGNEGEALFAVNLFSPQESDVAPAQNLPVLDLLEDDEDQTTQLARRELWRPLGFVALAILLAEWMVYQRANLARLLSSLPKRLT